MLHPLILLLLYAAVLPALSLEFTNLWPLNSLTLAYDVISQQDATFPNLTQCARTGSTPDGLALPSIRLSMTSYIDLPVATDFSRDNTFSLNFNPFQLRGTLFDYNSPTRTCRPDSDTCFWKVMAQLTSSGGINVTMEGHTTPMRSFVLPMGVTAEKWYYMHVGIDVSKMEVAVELRPRSRLSDSSSGAVVFGAGSDSYNLATPGVLRLGADVADRERLAGEVTCVALNPTKAGSYQDQDTACNAATIPWWLGPTCLRTTDAVQAFPLKTSGAGFDVIQKKDMRLVTSGSFLRVENDVAGLSSLMMDGSPLSTLDLQLNMESVQGDFTLAFYVNMDALFLGTIAHAQFPSRALGATDVEVVAEEDSVVATVEYLNLQGQPESALVRAERSGVTDGWQIVALRWSAPYVTLMVGANTQGFSNALDPQLLTFPSSGSLRVGGSFRGQNEGLHGHVGCVVVFGLAIRTMSELLQQTNAVCSMGPVPPGKLINADIICHANFHRIARNYDVIKFQPVFEFNTVSLSACAAECKIEELCRSFSVSKVTGLSQGRICRLYDHVTRLYLERKEGSDYYAVAGDSSACVFG